MIDGKDYPSLDFYDINLEGKFNEQCFEIIAKFSNGIDYSLKIEKTREQISPENSKVYSRKGKIIIALKKESNSNWFTLKGFD